MRKITIALIISIGTYANANCINLISSYFQDTSYIEDISTTHQIKLAPNILAIRLKEPLSSTESMTKLIDLVVKLGGHEVPTLGAEFTGFKELKFRFFYLPTDIDEFFVLSKILPIVSNFDWGVPVIQNGAGYLFRGHLEAQAMYDEELDSLSTAFNPLQVEVLRSAQRSRSLYVTLSTPSPSKALQLIKELIRTRKFEFIEPVFFEVLSARQQAKN